MRFLQQKMASNSFCLFKISRPLCVWCAFSGSNINCTTDRYHRHQEVHACSPLIVGGLERGIHKTNL